MKIKAFVTSLLVGAGLFAMVGSASAACTYRVIGDINIYGASAQFVFWQNEAPNYLAKAGCTPKFGGSWAASSVQDVAANPSHFAVIADCSAVANAPATVTFRVSSKASFDGPLAADGQVIAGITTNNCGVGAAANQREMLHGENCVTAQFPNGWGNLACGAPSAARGDCTVVNWGASDVAVGDFQQSGGAAPNNRNFKLNPVVMGNSSDICNAAAVPFGFFVNTSVISNATGTVLGNISEQEARMIFAGNMTNWNQLSSSPLNAQAIVACYRNPGSGTHATLDFQIVRPDTLFKNAGNATHVWNESTGNMMTCISTHAGAIGYSDADRLIFYPIASVSGPLTVNGIAPNSANLISGTYWYTDGSQHAYVNNAVYVSPGMADMMDDLCSYAGRPDRLAAVNPLWAATCQMNALPKNFGSLATWAPSSVKGTNGCTCVGL